MSEAQPAQKPQQSGGSTTKKKTRKKDKKIKIEISLWINKVKYEFGVLCTFCAKVAAICHCPECPDFFCGSCDVTAHNTKKRKDHKRTALSKLNLHTAAHLITRAVRYHGHLRQLQARCRKVYKRFFDRKSLNYYYYNPIYDYVTWRKPYCLRKQEFAPYMDPSYAACKCQNLYHNWRARLNVRTELLAQYRKIFDRRIGRFYYAFNGPSSLLPRSNWRKPRYFGKRSFPRDLLPVFTADVAAIVIQRKWRAILVLKFLRALARASFDEVWDPVKGRYNYYHLDSETLFQDKPKILRNETWDPNRIPDWTVDRVCRQLMWVVSDSAQVSIFLRRIGLKEYVELFRNYEVNGKVLMLLEDEDYENMHISNRLHKKKIQVEVAKLFKVTNSKQLVMSEAHASRREKIRRQKMFNAAALLIQKNFRVHVARNEVKLMREIERIQRESERMRLRIEEGGKWWSESHQVINMQPTDVLRFVEGDLKLPPVKSFGRRRDYLPFRGWGRRGNDLAGSWLPSLAAATDKSFIGDSPASKLYVDKLNINGYDEKRLEQFKQKMFIG